MNKTMTIGSIKGTHLRFPALTLIFLRKLNRKRKSSTDLIKINSTNGMMLIQIYLKCKNKLFMDYKELKLVKDQKSYH